jgi:biotin carboxyl carrier protein
MGDLSESPVTVRVNGEPFQVSWQRDQEGEAPTPPTVRAEPSVDSSKPTGGDDAARQVSAPMPGTVLDVQVEPGDTVAYQQELCCLEAMKMKNSIRSPRAGRIAQVKVTEGEIVAYGDPLFTFE